MCLLHTEQAEVCAEVPKQEQRMRSPALLPAGGFTTSTSRRDWTWTQPLIRNCSQTTHFLFPKEYENIFLGGRTGRGIQWCSVYCIEKTSSGNESLRMGNTSYSQQGKKKHRKIMKILPNLRTLFFYYIFFILC